VAIFPHVYIVQIASNSFAIARAYLLRLDAVRDVLHIPRMSALRGLRFIPRPVIYVGLDEDEVPGGGVSPALASTGSGTIIGAAGGVDGGPDGDAVGPGPRQVTLPHSTKLLEL
jgi:hypothetical protein